MMKIESNLSKVYYEEALLNAAEARADRKARGEKNKRSNVYNVLLLLAVVVWLFQSFIAG